MVFFLFFVKYVLQHLFLSFRQESVVLQVGFFVCEVVVLVVYRLLFDCYWNIVLCGAGWLAVP